MKQAFLRAGFHLAWVSLLTFGAILYAGVSAYLYLEPSLPDVEALGDVRLQVPLRVFSRDGRLIAQIGEYRRIPVAYEDVPPRVVKAMLAAEDDRFFAHHGVDYAGLTRATINYVATGQRSQGGGTITMQLARNIFFTPERTWRRKLSEIFLSFRIENSFSKQEILTLYFNKIFLGQRAYGVAAAAEVYFGKTLPELTLAEIATLAGLPQAPSRDNPVTSPERAKQRRAYVLRRMAETGVVTAEEAAVALDEPMQSQLHGPAVEVEAPYVAEMARAEAFARYGERIYTAGYKVITTIDSRLQHSANNALRLGLIEYDRRHGYRGPLAQIAIPAGQSGTHLTRLLEPYTGIGLLEPALVTKVEERWAEVLLKDGSARPIAWTGLAWAKKAVEGGVGPSPQTATDVLQAGDIVYVVRVGTQAQLAQLPVAQGALVAMDPRDGAIVALNGGFDYFVSKYNRAMQARRQPGSAFKPFVYSAALEHGFTPSSVVLDAPVVFDDDNNEDSWRPENSTGEFYGPTRLREALVRSRNLVSVRLMRAMGIETTTDYLSSHFGFASDILPRNLTLALGTLQLTPTEVAAGYSTFANGGFRVLPYYIERIEDTHGATLYTAEPLVVCADCQPWTVPRTNNEEDGEPQAVAEMNTAPPVPAAPPLDFVAELHARMQANPGLSFLDAADGIRGGAGVLPQKRIAPRAIDAQNAWLITDMMRDVIRRGTARRALALERNDLAGKTGTTSNQHDAWFSGFNAALVATAWVGFDQEASLGPNEEGGRTALPIWVHFMRDALQGMPDSRPRVPPGLVTVKISPTTGRLASANDSHAIFETFMEGHLPEASDPFDRSPGRDSSSEEPLF